QARGEGAAFLLDRGARWLACTDGDRTGYYNEVD
ncbi:hypothetical protein Pgy4_41789, partial [Pseudomonas savastanoi pv. glycinea str. race 4]